MKKLLEKVAKLIDVKSIVTLLLTVVFAILAMRSVISEQFLTIYTVIISFYFGTQAGKKGSEDNESKSE